MTELELILELVRNNTGYIEVIKNDISHLESSVAVLQSQVGEMIWLTRLVTAAVLGMLVEMFFRVYSNYKNRK